MEEDGGLGRNTSLGGHGIQSHRGKEDAPLEGS